MNRQVRVIRRASGVPTPADFVVTEGTTPQCPKGGVLLSVLYAAVDPAMRGWMSAEPNYITVADGDVMRAHGVGRVLQSDCPQWHEGDLAYGWLGWQEIAAVRPAELLWQVDRQLAPPPVWLSVLGLNGLAAWLGLIHLARPKPNDTVVVSTAVGGVGGVVGQLAAARGLHAVGITGGIEKTAMACTEFGYTAAIDYRHATDVEAELKKLCPDGVDIFFDNTGGDIADNVFTALNVGARIVQCGTIMTPDWTVKPMGPRRERDMLIRRLNWMGLLVTDHPDQFDAALAELGALLAEGKLVARHDILVGLDKAPSALERLYSGQNTGRLMIAISD